MPETEVLGLGSASNPRGFLGIGSAKLRAIFCWLALPGVRHGRRGRVKVVPLCGVCVGLDCPRCYEAET